MTDYLQTVEDHIKAEWNGLRAWIATHQTITIGTTLLIGVVATAWVLGRLHLPL